MIYGVRRYRNVWATCLATVLVCGLVLAWCAAAVPTAQANSAQRMWSGASTIAVGAKTQCPLEVQHEDLAFDLDTLPAPYEEEAKADYSAKVTAEYTFYNPTDSTVSAVLAFPYGALPDYWYYDTEESTAVAQQYGVTVGGNAVPTTTRHTYWERGDWDTDSELARLDERRDDAPWTATTPLTIRYYRVTIQDQEDDYAATAACEWTMRDDCTLMVAASGYERTKTGAKVGVWASAYPTIAVCYLGTEPAIEPQWKLYENMAWKKEIEGSVLPDEGKPCVHTTLGEWLGENRPAEVSEGDWYNACIDYMQAHVQQGTIRLSGSIRPIDPTLMQWYEYTIQLAGHASQTNRVTAPMYPTIDAHYEPTVYHYEYYLSPARTWAAFGDLDIRINTPYALVEDGGLEWTTTETGYRCALDALPRGELRFGLCTQTDPAKVKEGTGKILGMLWPLLLTAGAIVLCLAVCVVVCLVIAKQRTKL